MIQSARRNEDGFIIAVIDGVEWTVPDDPANRYRQMIAEWEAEGNTIPAHEPPPSPTPVIALPQIVAQARLRIADWNVTGMNGNSNLGLAMPWGDGVIYCEFLTPLDNDDYIVTPTNGNTHHCYVNPDEQQPGGFLLYTEDKDGNPSFPACVQLLVTR